MEKSCLWHYHLLYINKKHIDKLQKDRILESFDLELKDVRESCLIDKIKQAHFTGNYEWGNDLMELIPIDVPFKSSTRHGERYFLTFVDDFSWYGYIYWMNHKWETFELFIEFQKEVKNELGKKIMMLRFDWVENTCVLNSLII